MNMKQYMRNLLVAAVVGASLWTPRAAPALEDNGGYVISEVVARQRWPWERKVDIDFQLTKPAWASSDQVVRIGVVASNDTREVAVSYAALAGTAALPGVSRRIVWDPTLDHPNKSFPQLKFYLSVISTNVEPEYLVINLDDGDIEYKDEYFAEEVNADLYKTEKMAFRYIPPGTFAMGTEGSGKATTLTKGFYMGVFEVTQEQWRRVKGVAPASRFTAEQEMRPKETVAYQDIRGSTLGAGWPTDSNVDTNSFLGILRDRTLINELDLPTEAQWEYACRAGTTTYYSDGEAAAPNDGVSLNTGESNTFINVLGRYKYNGGCVWNGSAWVQTAGTVGPTNGTAIVGSYLPNAWGLYDVHGNVYEWCLDWHASSLTGGVDPKGAAVGSSRVLRGGSWDSAASYCRSAFRFDYAPSDRYIKYGFRLVRTLP